MHIIIIHFILKLYMHTFYQQELPFHHMTHTRMVHHLSYIYIIMKSNYIGWMVKCPSEGHVLKW